MRAFMGLIAVLVLPPITLSSVPAAAADFEAPLSVEESLGLARTGEPISGGVPLPRGLLRKDQPFALFRADGAEVPCQTSPLVVETDGSLRWVLVDLTDDVAAGAVNRYVLKAAAPKARPKTALKLRETAEAVTIDTGAIQVTVSKQKPFGLFDAVRAGGQPVIAGGAVTYTQLQGRKGWNDPAAWTPVRLDAGPPQSVRVYYSGPLRVTVEVAGRFAGDPLAAGYQAWITAWAGSSRVHVKNKLSNSNPDQYTALPVVRSAIELRLAPGDRTVWLGAREPIEAGSEGWLHQGLYLHHTYQDIPDAVRAGSASKELWKGSGPKDRAQGWIAALGPGGVAVADRLFSSDPARRLMADPKRLVLEGIAARFDGPKDQKFREDRRVGQPWAAAPCWLYDCTHHSSECLFDFAPPEKPEPIAALARAAGNRLWLRAPGSYYSECDALGTGRFGTLDDETACYRQWGWTFKPEQAPERKSPLPDAFVAGEDNHGESEADSVQGLLLMYLRTGQRGWLDLAEAWARYHADLQAWRTDGWAWKDGAIWFPTGGPQGNLQVRKKWNFDWGPNWGQREKDPDCADLWRHSQSKSCYCHFYGSGLADWFCLTGDRDALAAALDNVEQKDDEFRRFRKFRPGETPVGCIRGFGRGFEVMMRVLQADPSNAMVRDLCHYSAKTLIRSPWLDERGFHYSHVGAGFSGMQARELTPKIQEWMKSQGIRFTVKEGTVDTLTKDGRTWPVRCMGGTWQHVYIHNGADAYARYFDDEDLGDFVIAFARMSARYMLSPKCHQTWYYTNFDVPDLGMVFDPWAFEHTATKDGEGCVHSGWYTRFYPDACAKGYSLTGDPRLLARAREFWYYGSKREYQTKGLRGGKDGVGEFASHLPPKDDSVLEVSRLLYEGAHPRADREPPAAVRDLAVRRLEGGKAEVSFTAPAEDSGKLARYQVKAAPLAIVDYDAFDYARDEGHKCNWWRAANCRGEPLPQAPGAKERFVVSGVPEGERLYFAVRTHDAAGNQGPVSNVAAAPDGNQP